MLPREHIAERRAVQMAQSCSNTVGGKTQSKEMCQQFVR